jgi:hypothetical protein
MMSVDWLKGFELDLWWNKLIAVGVAIVVAALAAKERGLIFVGLGLIAIGFGELLNHRRHESITPPSAWQPQFLITGHLRMPHPLGLAIDGVGVILMLVGLYRLLTA